MEFPMKYFRAWIICDDPDACYVWSQLLKRKGIEVFLTDNLTSFKKNIHEDQPDLVIIDETTSKTDAIKIIQDLKPEIMCPFLLLTANNNEAYILEAYQAGADECFSKPISPALFLSKVRALLRHAETIPITALERVETAGLNLDPIHRKVFIRNGKEIKLSQLEFRLLNLLMNNPGWVFNPEQIVQAVWGYSEIGDSRLLKHLIFRLRQKIEDDPKKPKIIKTEPGIGYKLDPYTDD